MARPVRPTVMGFSRKRQEERPEGLEGYQKNGRRPAASCSSASAKRGVTSRLPGASPCWARLAAALCVTRSGSVGLDQVKPAVAALKERNRNIRSRARLGKRQWHTRSGYSRRSMVENTMYRYKAIIGPTMRSRTLQGQRVEARVGCKILNTMADLAMPQSHRVG